MPYYLFTGPYTGEAIKGMIDQPEDRTETSGALIAAFGGRLDRYFMALGDVDFFLIAEFPSNEAAISCAAVVVASWTVADFKTTPLVHMAEMPQVFRSAQDAVSRYKAAVR
jgi:uncharacterized protein with GYD domain